MTPLTSADIRRKVAWQNKRRTKSGTGIPARRIFKSQSPAAKLRFDILSSRNLERCQDVFHPLHAWSSTDWACAMAGECGEACNLIKKLHRGENISGEDIALELADLIIYADLLAQRLNIDLGAAVIAKFNEVSIRHLSDIKLEASR